MVDHTWLSAGAPTARPSPRGWAIIGDRLPRSPQPVEGLALVIAGAARVQGVLGPVDEPTARFGQRDLDLKSRATQGDPAFQDLDSEPAPSRSASVLLYTANSGTSPNV
jgi:hypothetical protein